MMSMNSHEEEKMIKNYKKYYVKRKPLTFWTCKRCTSKNIESCKTCVCGKKKNNEE